MTHGGTELFGVGAADVVRLQTPEGHEISMGLIELLDRMRAKAAKLDKGFPSFRIYRGSNWLEQRATVGQEKKGGNEDRHDDDRNQHS